MDTITRCLDMFCSLSGQKMSAGKTRLLVSNKVNHNAVRELRELSGFALTRYLERYFGVPLIHGLRRKRCASSCWTKLNAVLEIGVLIVCRLQGDVLCQRRSLRPCLPTWCKLHCFLNKFATNRRVRAEGLCGALWREKGSVIQLQGVQCVNLSKWLG